jgi:hypothetical protein
MVIFNIASLYLVKRYGIFARLVMVPDLSKVETEFVPEVADQFGKKFHGKDIHQIRSLIMQEVKTAEGTGFDTSLSLLDSIESGKGLVCGGMSAVYFNSLVAQGHKARIVSWFRHRGITHDAHITVEVFENGKWVLYDPTFNTAFLKDKTRLGSKELQNIFLAENSCSVKFEFFGEVNYPPRLKDYYINWQPLVNNIFVVGRSVSLSRDRFGFFLAKFPPFRYWFGPVYFYEKELQVDQHIINKTLYFLSMVVLPIADFGLFVLWILQVRQSFRLKADPIT